MSEDVEIPIKQESESISLHKFLEDTPPSQLTAVSNIATDRGSDYGNQRYEMCTPEIRLHCAGELCNGIRFFRCVTNPPRIYTKKYEFFYLTYVCANCQNMEKMFSIAASVDDDGLSGKCFKFGEFPPYGPPTPSRLISLIGPDREIFLQGRRCENQGLGIGAFVYYRRVVENQKNRILDEIIKVSEKLSVASNIIDVLKAAKSETQFSRALASVKDAVPEVLLLNGRNPLTMLHSALSDGLHSKTDEDCLELASSVRVVLGALAERLSQALSDEAELNAAISKLTRAKEKESR